MHSTETDEDFSQDVKPAEVKKKTLNGGSKESK